ncbi:activating signal cointegrator 1 complex subunit 2 homolog [Plodia interpunctella]|uniref:activating signal cointegrator 1 complex subunit 2 homolog n=1 Tax=Plodia interpunctella TaxID=58824 RepID=UPI00236790C0|nr:activating signal cointegrator 1 complex subunit 2 homolog [Plodia interpunctella]XP_053611085.1 activating signal cointegrator 1 complex subunit 2 homolog [Plodia interpunctella]
MIIIYVFCICFQYIDAAEYVLSVPHSMSKINADQIVIGYKNAQKEQARSIKEKEKSLISFLDEYLRPMEIIKQKFPDHKFEIQLEIERDDPAAAAKQITRRMMGKPVHKIDHSQLPVVNHALSPQVAHPHPHAAPPVPLQPQVAVQAQVAPQPQSVQQPQVAPQPQVSQPQILPLPQAAPQYQPPSLQPSPSPTHQHTSPTIQYYQPPQHNQHPQNNEKTPIYVDDLQRVVENIMHKMNNIPSYGYNHKAPPYRFRHGSAKRSQINLKPIIDLLGKGVKIQHNVPQPSDSNMNWIKIKVPKAKLEKD